MGASRTVILLGSGFSAAANVYAQRQSWGGMPLYPLLRDLAEVCFPDGYDLSQGIEAAFATAQDRHDPGPVDRLVETIETADFYTGTRAAEDRTSFFHALLDRYSGADILTFNYDCCVELVLFQRGTWNPADGFGVKAEVELPFPGSTIEASPNHVLHVHGSLYLYATDFDFVPDVRGGMTMLRRRPEPRYTFDPGALTSVFVGYPSGPQTLGYKLPGERIIAPLPDKSAARFEGYVQHTYKLARERLAQCDLLIAIGYSFADTDRASFAPLISALPRGARVVVVSPDAATSVARLRGVYPAIKWHDIPLTLEKWARAGFRES